LKVSSEPQENCEVVLTIELDAKQEDKILKDAARRIARQVAVPGYRPGKAPYNLILRRFGEEVIQQEAVDGLTDKVYKQAIKEIDLTPYGPGSLTDVDWHPLVIKVSVPTEPEVDLGNYRQLRLEVEEISVADEEVEAALLEVQERHAVYTPVDRPAELGDLVSVTLTEQDGDRLLVENRQTELYLEEPSEEDSDQPDLTTSLLGLAANDQKTFTVTYPDDDDDERYAGKSIETTVQIIAVKEKEAEPLDDDFASLVGDFDTLDELRDELRKDQLERLRRERDLKLMDEMLAKVIEQAPVIKWPAVLEEEQIDRMIHNLAHRLEQNDQSLQLLLKMQNKTLDEFRQEVLPQAQESVRRQLVLKELAELEKLTVDAKQIRAEAENLSQLLGGTQEARDLYYSDAGFSAVANDLILSAVRERLIAIALGEAPDLDEAAGEGETGEPIAESAAAPEAETATS
jgi:trigger factor